jgi:membrane-associated progesterone receptor component
MDLNRPVIDIGGQQIPLSSDFKVGPITSGDLSRTIVQYAQMWKITWITEFNSYILDLKAGKTSALLSLLISIGLGAWLIYLIWCNFLEPADVEQATPMENPKDPIELRDFTIEQLREFDGSKGKPIYIGLNGDVFDVSGAPEYYGVGAAYHCFAGRNSTRAMAKFSFEEAELANNEISDLSPFEKSTLEDWVQKFKYFKCYPVVGKYSFPPNLGCLKSDELIGHIGREVLKPDRINPPVLVCLKSKIYDVSYGGFDLYGPDGPYHIFAGKDASRALAKMSFQTEDIQSNDLSDLNPQQLKTLDEWIQKFEQVKKYPVVGSLST